LSVRSLTTRSVFKHNLPFEKPGRFYRGNIHCHSTPSDGTLSPEDVVAAYREQGYDFLAITDHFWYYDGKGVTDTRSLGTPSFVTLLVLVAPAKC